MMGKKDNKAAADEVVTIQLREEILDAMNDADREMLTQTVDSVAEAALTGILAQPGFDNVSAAVATVWRKIVPEYFNERDAFFAQLFGEEAGPATQGDGE